MLENIKSSFFLKFVFSHLYKEIQLKLINYSKKLQKTLGISLIDYRINTNRYIIYESNNIAKEFDIYNDKLIFEGEYLNAKRNGKGKEYNKYGELQFEGEYLNGKRNGKGKEYNHYGKLKFEGEYLNGKRKYNYENDKLKLEGEYLNRKRKHD